MRGVKTADQMTAIFKTSTIQSTCNRVWTFAADNTVCDIWTFGDYTCHKKGQMEKEELDKSHDDVEKE